MNIERKFTLLKQKKKTLKGHIKLIKTNQKMCEERSESKIKN